MAGYIAQLAPLALPYLEKFLKGAAEWGINWLSKKTMGNKGPKSQVMGDKSGLRSESFGSKSRSYVRPGSYEEALEQYYLDTLRGNPMPFEEQNLGGMGPRISPAMRTQPPQYVPPGMSGAQYVSYNGATSRRPFATLYEPTGFPSGNPYQNIDQNMYFDDQLRKRRQMEEDTYYGYPSSYEYPASAMYNQESRRLRTRPTEDEGEFNPDLMY